MQRLQCVNDVLPQSIGFWIVKPVPVICPFDRSAEDLRTYIIQALRRRNLNRRRACVDGAGLHAEGAGQCQTRRHAQQYPSFLHMVSSTVAVAGRRPGKVVTGRWSRYTSVRDAIEIALTAAEIALFPAVSAALFGGLGR